eukprot:scaffold6208_cov34-Tisochrysis_lutea.AAC.3
MTVATATVGEGMIARRRSLVSPSLVRHVFALSRVVPKKPHTCVHPRVQVQAQGPRRRIK